MGVIDFLKQIGRTFSFEKFSFFGQELEIFGAELFFFGWARWVCQGKQFNATVFECFGLLRVILDCFWLFLEQLWVAVEFFVYFWVDDGRSKLLKSFSDLQFLIRSLRIVFDFVFDGCSSLWKAVGLSLF